MRLTRIEWGVVILITVVTVTWLLSGIAASFRSQQAGQQRPDAGVK